MRESLVVRLLVAVLICAVGASAAGAGVDGALPPYQALAERIVGEGQGVYAVAGDGTVLAAVAADRAVHPASVSKVPSTLALLRTLGPDYRFATRLRGPRPHEGVVPGDLLVEASGDPFLLPQSVGSMLGALGDSGIAGVAGRVRVEGPLFYDWKPDPAGKRLQGALSGQISQAAWQEVRERRARRGDDAALETGLVFDRRKTSIEAPPQTLLVHLSPPLPRILKELNAYSNNIFHPLSDRIGGPAAVQRIARESAAGIPAEEIVITNAAGAGQTNRLSPRAAVALYGALGRELERHGLAYSDVLPVAGRDRGTLERRLDAPAIRGAVVGKTGTYGSLGACALAGVARTRRWGDVTFAILNRDVPVLEARRRQDAFLAALLADAGARPFAYEPLPSPILAEERVMTHAGKE